MFGISEIGVLLIVVVVVLGAKKLPELVRGAGKAARILKSETKALKDGDDTRPPQAAPDSRVIRGTTVDQHDGP
ncbi:twin-arginine translocase TatA/TatE family subunit [Streptomyces sp. AK02-01A]|uniref:twin-arginine translocase TatA/TatE family subunit n=1 Tax=Streptomyces sp. AK02-01A TaxID=3028648 RepID=UPI0029A93E61|nr:twin-arginine translocase TatA/TatE family subunit [Streptomyces sp. AK02-01A]MDX3850275.1 twin-arginine translocase TatA/TatE family subunit [Streptomyces sp. AK02-01A]